MASKSQANEALSISSRQRATYATWRTQCRDSSCKNCGRKMAKMSPSLSILARNLVLMLLQEKVARLIRDSLVPVMQLKPQQQRQPVHLLKMQRLYLLMPIAEAAERRTARRTKSEAVWPLKSNYQPDNRHLWQLHLAFEPTTETCQRYKS